MSEMERNKGTLKWLGVDTEHFTEEDFGTYRENGFMVLDGEVYEVHWEVKDDTEGYFAEVTTEENGDIHFHTYHYNGGGSLEDVIEGVLND